MFGRGSPGSVHPPSPRLPSSLRFDATGPPMPRSFHLRARLRWTRWRDKSTRRAKSNKPRRGEIFVEPNTQTILPSFLFFGGVAPPIHQSCASGPRPRRRKTKKRGNGRDIILQIFHPYGVLIPAVVAHFKVQSREAEPCYPVLCETRSTTRETRVLQYNF